jgi:hypothetical protein
VFICNFFLGCTYAKDKCDDDYVVKCISKSKIKNCCQYINDQKCDDGNYLEDDIYEIYRGCIWRDTPDNNKCESFKCSDYENKKDCKGAGDRKNVKEECEWVRVVCIDGITAEAYGKCASKGSLNSCCYYNVTNCGEAIIKVDDVSKKCYWEGSYTDGECVDFTCNKYVGEGSCKDNIYNVNGGCFFSGGICYRKEIICGYYDEILCNSPDNGIGNKIYINILKFI